MDWKDYWATAPERSRSTDFYRHIGKTAGGQPFGNEQAALMVGQLRKCLSIQPSDVVWDLCCGNGLITHKIAAYCRQIAGRGLLGLPGRSCAKTPVPRQRRLPCRVSPRTFSSSSAWRTLHQDLPTRRAALLHSPKFSGATATLAEPGTSDAWVNFGAVPNRAHHLCFRNTPERKRDYFRRRRADNEIGSWWQQGVLRQVAYRIG